MLSVGYDLPTVLSTNDPTVAAVNKFTEVFLDYGNPGNYLVEFFPWMKNIPSSLAKWKREAEKGYIHYTEIWEGMFREVENRIVTCLLRLPIRVISLILISLQNQGDERASFAGSLIRGREHSGLTDTEASWLTATL